MKKGPEDRAYWKHSPGFGLFSELVFHERHEGAFRQRIDIVTVRRELRAHGVVIVFLVECVVHRDAEARSADLLSFTYGSQIPVAGQALPGFSDGNGLRITPDGSTMRVELDVYDRETGAKTLTSTFSGCTAH